MSWTKRELIAAAYRKLGMANYIFDLEPLQLQSACADMDALVGSWNSVNIGYAFADSPSTADIDVDSGVPAYANAAIYLNLALSLASDMGKNISPTLMGEAKKAYLSMLKAAMPATLEYQMPSSLPRGAGQKPWRNATGPFMPTPSDPIETGLDGDLELLN
jgi:hypothetical protein